MHENSLHVFQQTVDVLQLLFVIPCGSTLPPTAAERRWMAILARILETKPEWKPALGLEGLSGLAMNTNRRFLNHCQLLAAFWGNVLQTLIAVESKREDLHALISDIPRVGEKHSRTLMVVFAAQT